MIAHSRDDGLFQQGLDLGLIGCLGDESAVGRSDFALAVAEQESGFTCNVISTADAMGVLQILYPTAVEMGFRGKPEELLRCHNSTKYGMKYLKFVLDEAGGDICLAASKYFAGVHSGFITSGEEYCRGVLDKMRHYKNANIARL